jgi:predicted metal-binding membrane protein
MVMTTAMMLPTTLPLVRMFQRLTGGRPDRVRLTTSLVAGYLSAWTVFGLLVWLVLWALRSMAPAALTGNARYVDAGLFALAGAFQFSALKYQCLDKCRSPLSFLTSRWRGSQHEWHSFRLGVEHGVFCVGCCWALMLLMFAFGTASVIWMLALAGVMALEKNMPWGRRLSTPLGVALLVIGVAILITAR